MTKNSAGFPEAFRARIASMLPRETDWAAFEAAYRVPLRRSVRSNRHVVDTHSFVARVRSQGWDLLPIPWEEDGFFVEREDRSVPIGKTMEHFLGLCYVQEASSMAPVRALCPRPGETVLDMSSAPGSKTTQASALMGNTGLVVANDVSVERTKATVTNIERQACANVAVTTMDARRFAALCPDSFDRVLLDAPCSGEGTFTKADDLFRRWNPYAIRRMAGIQRGLIEAAFRCLRPGGTMVYSTCTFAPEENEDVVASLLAQFPGNAQILALDERFPRAAGLTRWEERAWPEAVSLTRRFWPHETGTGGFFVALIGKQATTGAERDVRRTTMPSREATPLSSREERDVQAFLAETYGIGASAWESRTLVEVGDAVWMRPAAATQLERHVRFDRCGTRLVVREHGNRWRLTTAGARVLQRHITTGRLVLDAESSVVAARGGDVALGVNVSHPVLCDPDGFVLGVGLSQEGRVKNQIPRALL